MPSEPTEINPDDQPDPLRELRELAKRKPFVTVVEACNLVSLGKTTVYSLMDLGELRFAKFGSARRIATLSLLEFAEKNLAN